MKLRYAAIFWAQPGPALRAVHGRHWYLFQRAFNNNTCDGYVLDNFYAMEGPDGWNRYGGVWSFKGTPSVGPNSSLADRVNYHLDCTKGRAGAALINLTTGQSVMAHADQRFGTASAIKVYVLYALLRKADAQGIDLDTVKIDRVTLRSLATAMIVNSSNSATNKLIDFVGMDRINDEIDALGLKVTTLGRYMIGGLSAHGFSTWFDDFKAGFDNFSTPREMATFYRLTWENQGLLKEASYTTYLDILLRSPSVANDVLPAGYDVDIYNKAGSITYTGNPGDFSHKPQAGTHSVTTDAGLMEFGNGQLVVFAVLIDEKDGDASAQAIACTGWEAAKEWGDGNAGTPAGFCEYP